MTIFEEAGGRPYFRALVAAFYESVADDPVLRPMYPEDLEGPAERLELFLVQFFGGPRDYEARRGHPRLRMRHLEFEIDEAARRAWMAAMDAAIDRVGTPEAVAAALRDYFESTSRFLVNSGGLSIAGSRGGDRGPGLRIGSRRRRSSGRRSETPDA